MDRVPGSLRKCYLKLSGEPCLGSKADLRWCWERHEGYVTGFTLLMGRTDGQWKAVKELQYGERACMVESVSISGDTCFMLVAHAMQGMAYWMSNVVTLKIARSREKSPDAPARLRQESDSFAHLAASLLSAPPEVKFRKDGTAPFVVWDTMAFPAMEYVVLVRSLATKRVIRFPAEGPPFRLPPRALFRDGPCVVAIEYGASRVRTAWSPAVNTAVYSTRRRRAAVLFQKNGNICSQLVKKLWHP